ncbi:TRAP transporter permease [Amorphus sp. 3PC139-8]|uniref:TRAP transporter permease n=1 Tax=Amorphus sp. 3PC139-8 TaxID=2735676 RepID=UPI00345CAF57
MFSISDSAAKRLLQAALAATGLFVALAGMANVLPSFGNLPRIGPFAIEWFRPLFFFASIVAVILAHLLARQRQGHGRWYVSLGYAALVVLTGWVCYDYYVLGRIMADSIVFFSWRDAAVATLAAAIGIWTCFIVWGAPIAILGLIAFLYLATGQYWPGFLQTVPTSIPELVAQNIWFDADQGILGSILGIVLSTVLPFIILGAILEGCGAGDSMIRISFSLMRKFRGGPAYAAIAASALFGTVSGSAVANVVGTGVVTIPMIRRRGFAPNFAGAVEATASTGGQILPPIMGAAALVMADYVGVSYLTVIIAVLIPAIAYYASLALAVYFEANRLGVEASEDDEAMSVERQDWLNLVLVFAPIGLIVWLLVSGLSPAGASIAAIFLLIPLSFINPEIRRKPVRLVGALARGGTTVAQLVTAIAVVGIVVSTLSATGMPTKFAVLLSSAGETSLLAALAISAAGCIVLGMGMPTLPAYIAIVAIMGPTLQRFGLEPLTSHMFVFFFGVASVITPPVAIAAYAAAAVSGGKPIATAVASSRLGAMIFIIPFAFVYNPILLLVDAAGANVTPVALVLAIGRLVLALYLCTSGLGGFDRTRLGVFERAARLAATVLLLSPVTSWQAAGAAIGLVALAWHLLRAAQPPTPENRSTMKQPEVS